MNILITGRPGIGKTTLIRNVAFNAGGNVTGFFTEEIKDNGRRSGFRIRTLDGKEGRLAGAGIKSPYRVGRYKVDLDEFERLALPSIRRDPGGLDTIIVDEIGPMELFSKKFRDAVLDVLDSENPVIATVKLKGSGFVEKIKSREDVMLFTLTEANRSLLSARILRMINERI